MGYYGASAYRGDYYGAGDYYRSQAGDPGFFDFLGNIATGIGGVVSKVLPIAAPVLGGVFGGPIGAAAGGLLGRVLGPGAPIPNPPAMQLPPTWAATAPGTGSTAAMIPFTPPTFAGVQIGGPSGVQIGRRTGMPGGSPVRAAAGLTVPIPRTPDHYAHHRHREGTPTHTVFRRVDQWEVKDHRRMNPLNPRALRKAIRRAGAFTKIVGKTLRFTKPGHHTAGFKKMGRKK